MAGIDELENSQTHFNLRLNLVEHLWAMKGLHQFDWKTSPMKLHFVQ
jgi:hypothetical protein